MKELKFNLRYLLNRKELYFSIIVIFFINLIHVILCVNESLRLRMFIENSYTSEYQFILYNAQIALNVLIIIVFPTALSLIFADSSWSDKKNKTINLLYTRLNYKKNIIVRLCLAVIVSFIISFVGFLLNYFLLKIIYGSGNNLTHFQSLAFSLTTESSWFLDDLRVSNPVAFAFVINCTVSLLLGLLSGLSYLSSFFIRKRIIIYFVPLTFLIMTDLLLPKIGIKGISFITMLQPFSVFTISEYVTGLVVLFCIILLLLFFSLKKRDVLV